VIDNITSTKKRKKIRFTYWLRRKMHDRRAWAALYRSKRGVGEDYKLMTNARQSTVDFAAWLF
jgi:hypothetical protein